LDPYRTPDLFPYRPLLKRSPWALRTGETGEQNWAIESG
jgi:hypothetical protein